MARRIDLSSLATYSHLGLTLAITTLGMFFLGYWIDGKIGTRPMLAIAGAFIGMTGGFIKLVRTLNRVRDEADRRKKDDGSED